MGDICLMEPGEIIPVDGIFISGHNVRCNESSVTGESDAIKKATFEVCMTEQKVYEDANARGEEPSEVRKDPFIISGSKVLEGVGSYVAIAVGERSMNGRILMGKSDSLFRGGELIKNNRSSRGYSKYAPPAQTEQPCGTDCKSWHCC